MGIKGFRIDKEEVKASLFTNDMTAYMKDTEEFIRKLLEVITTFSKMARYNINIQTSSFSMFE